MRSHALMRIASTMGLATLLGTAAPVALAQQAAPTAPTASVGVSPEQLLALVGRLDALEKRNEELEAQILDLKTTQASGDQAPREQFDATTVSLASVRFLTDFQHVEVDRLSPGGTAFGAGALTPPAGGQIGQDLNIWSIRTQYAF